MVAAGVSIALHLGVVGLVLRPGGSAPGLPAAKPVQVDVLRLTGLISRVAAPPPTTTAPTQAPAQEDRRARPSAAKRPDSAPLTQGRVEGLVAAAEATPVVAGGLEETGELLAAPPGVALDTTALSRRLQQVALRCYPAAARRFRQTGEAQVRFCLDAAGGLREATVSSSSGSDLLDAAATGCVIPGATPFGPETFGRCFTVPVRFNP